MNRKQIINVLLSLSMVFMAVMPMNGVIALAAEAAEGATAGITAPAEPEEIGEAPETVAEEIMSDDTAGPEESQAADTSDDMRTDSAETAMTVEEEDAAEEVQRDAMEYGSDDTSGSNDYDFPVIVIDDPPAVHFGDLDIPLPASTKVTTTNVASGLKVRWEPVQDAKEYVVYRGSTLIKRTSKTEITDTDLKYDNGKKFTHKVAAVSRTGRISAKVRTSTYYRLLPVGIKSLKSPSAGKMTVTYDKNGKGSGYVVRFGLKSDMSDAKVITVKDPAVTTKTFSGLQEGKT